MKKILFSVLLGLSLSATAQNFNLPAQSPRQSIEQQLSISSIKVDYGRPAVKGREIFGKLVPFNEVWRAGANACTKITFGQDFIFGGKLIKAGTYGLFILPTATEWTVILNKDANQWGAFSFDAKLNVLETKVPVLKTTAVQEYFKIDLDNLTDHSADLIFMWDKTKAVVPIQVAHPEEILKIQAQLTEINKIRGEMSKMK